MVDSAYLKVMRGSQLVIWMMVGITPKVETLGILRVIL
jgi:hypothetical protein